MAKVKIRSYCSPNLVLLALDWPEGKNYDDFLGFAIMRRPGIAGYAQSWLPNRIGFYGPSKRGLDFPSHKCPIQKFLWWDSRIDLTGRQKSYYYEVTPIRGTPKEPELIKKCTNSLQLTLPNPVTDGIGTYFNRAVVSSQAFSKKFGRKLDDQKFKQALEWLANGIEKVIPEFLEDSPAAEGAIYHLTDNQWVIPAMVNYNRRLSLVYDARDGANDNAVEELGKESKVQLLPRTRTKIMHNKFLVRIKNRKPSALLMGSANFTTDGLTTQANVLHTFESPELAKIYLERKELLEEDPTIGQIAREAEWSKTVKVGKSSIRAFFSPEPKPRKRSKKKPSRIGIDAVVRAVEHARKSVVFCLFSPTDKPLRDAIFDAGDEGKMMFGLINSISNKKPKGGKDAGSVAKVDIYHRSRNEKDTFAHSLFPKGEQPLGFWWEVSSIPGKGRKKFPVYIHHKFVLIDAETDNPTIYTGSANLSNASSYSNDENMLEIKGNPELAQTYLCEFLRLYEHYRARVMFQRWHESENDTFRLKGDSGWARKAFTPKTPEYKARVQMAS